MSRPFQGDRDFHRIPFLATSLRRRGVTAVAAYLKLPSPPPPLPPPVEESLEKKTKSRPRDCADDVERTGEWAMARICRRILRDSLFALRSIGEASCNCELRSRDEEQLDRGGRRWSVILRWRSDRSRGDSGHRMSPGIALPTAVRSMLSDGEFSSRGGEWVDDEFSNRGS
ncbi:hypothetical protein TIFTF001_003948 [Ficus carica]|uniref:Uncharacterized protein n=1 Tax=Ficus carica TaxID=3494 RepID=A0AA87ZTV0_FICCA|nr:hypothetical protein TIFTF001_003948 [Ficus carica]